MWRAAAQPANAPFVPRHSALPWVLPTGDFPLLAISPRTHQTRACLVSLRSRRRGESMISIPFDIRSHPPKCYPAMRPRRTTPGQIRISRFPRHERGLQHLLQTERCIPSPKNARDGSGQAITIVTDEGQYFPTMPPAPTSPRIAQAFRIAGFCLGDPQHWQRPMKVRWTR